jgi:pimeloyl-ACP methyl ester carboxylesterase
VVFVHGLGGSHTNFVPLISEMQKHKGFPHIFLDLEGHGLSPTKASSVVSIQSYVEDLHETLQRQDKVSRIDIVAHDLGCLVAMRFAEQ